MTNLNESLKQFEATEANLAKLDRLWREIKKLIPDGICFGETPVYVEKYRLFRLVLKNMPAIQGHNLEDYLLEENAIAQMRLDAKESMEIEYIVDAEESIIFQEKALAEYRFRLNQSRKTLIRDAALELVREIDAILETLQSTVNIRGDKDWSKPVTAPGWDDLNKCVLQLEALFGSSADNLDRWGAFNRHLSFGQICDLRDIIKDDWPAIKSSMERILYGRDDPLPVAVKDLSELVKSKPKGHVITELDWSTLSAEEFERLVFNIVSGASGYENPQWLTRTKAPDRGRDISVTKVIEDSLGEIERKRVIIQCKNWSSKSVALTDVSSIKDQMKLWEPPRIDVLIVATSGRFTTDAVSYIEKHNQGKEALRIEMWPGSHLERILAKRPALIAEFQLRK